MKPIDQYKSLGDFTTDLDHSPNEFVPFKIFGPRVPLQPGRNSEFHSATMLNYIYKNIENPDSVRGRSLFWAPFGEINNRGTRLLGGGDTYSKIQAHSSGHNLFQGDIIELGFSVGGNAPTNYGAIFSHSCEIPREAIISVLPVYFESQITSQIADAISNKVIKPQNLNSILQNWFSNENKRFIGLPPTNVRGNDERVLIHLRPVAIIESKVLPANPILRLTYRSLSYFQLRVAHFFIRDVQNSDETRDM